MVEALARPLEYPSLASATIPGDRIVLAIEPGVPQVDRVVAAVVEYLRKAGVGADGLAVLRSSADAADPRTLVPKEVGDQIALYTHDPTDSNSLGYLAATEEGRPILLNRAILRRRRGAAHRMPRPAEAPEYHGIHGAIYPTFSDQQTLTRFRSLRLLNPRDALKKDLVKLCNQVGWLLGLSFTIQVVPGAGEEVLHVVAGEVTRCASPCAGAVSGSVDEYGAAPSESGAGGDRRGIEPADVAQPGGGAGRGVGPG